MDTDSALQEQLQTKPQDQTVVTSNEKSEDSNGSLVNRFFDFVKSKWSLIRCMLLILAIVLGAALFAQWNSQRAQQFSKKELDGVRDLVHYASTSAEQGQRTANNSLQSLLHTNYALCFLNAAKHMVGDMETLQQIAPQIDVLEFKHNLQQFQAQQLNKIVQQCMLANESNKTQSPLTN